MYGPAAEKEQADQYRPQSRPVAGIVVSSALPLGESVPEKVIVSVTRRATEDTHDGIQAGCPLGGFLDCLVDLAFRRTFRDVDAGFLPPGLVAGLPRVVCNECPFNLVRMQLSGELSIGFVNLVEVGVWFDAQEVYSIVSHERNEVKQLGRSHRKTSHWDPPLQ